MARLRASHSQEQREAARETAPKIYLYSYIKKTTNRAACEELLLENDTHWDTTIVEAIISASPSQIRTLFAIIISTCFPSNSSNRWHKYKDNMAEDILHQIRVSSRNPDLEMNEEIHNRALLLIEDMC